MDTRIDFKTALKLNLLELIDWKTDYGDFKIYIRKGFTEKLYNLGTNLSKNAEKGEYIKPFILSNYGPPMNIYEVLDREDIWLDIGGHLGFFAIRMLSQFPKIKKIISYEALPHNVSFAIENLKLNGLSEKCEFIQKAIVYNNEEFIDFYISTDTGKHSIVPIKGRDKIKVPAININDVIELHKPTAIKMDVEGAEYKLIKEIKDWSNIRLAIIEWHFNSMRPSFNNKNKQESFYEALNIFKNNGFNTIRKIENVENKKTYITHFVAIKD